MKRCSICLEVKEISFYQKDITKLSGLRNDCKSCCSKRKLANYKKNKNKLNSISREYRIKNLDKIKKYLSVYREQNREKAKEYSRNYGPLYYLNNRESICKKNREYVKKNLVLYNAKAKKRYTLKMNRAPKWLTDSQWEEIKEWYILAKELQWLSEEKLEVDHIVPLQGKNVSGLHVPWNLQILPKSLNSKKSNKLEVI